jgi:hypothetical protein
MSLTELLALQKWLLVIALMFPLLLILCFHFVLSFFESLHKGDHSRASQNKNYAFLFFTLFIYIPLFFYVIVNLIVTGR